jgi:hypothetical protein
MSSSLVPRPLLTWDAFTMRLDLDMLEVLLNRELPPKVDEIERLRVGGDGEIVELSADLELKGFPARVTVRLRDLRLYRRFVGAFVESVHGPLGIRLPIGIVAHFVEKVPGGLVRLDEDDRILLIDLQRWLPLGIDVRVGGVRCVGRWLELDLAPGSVAPRLTTSAQPTEQA